MQVRKQQLELVMEQQTGSKLGKEYVKIVYCHPAYAEYIMENEKVCIYTYICIKCNCTALLHSRDEHIYNIVNQLHFIKISKKEV